MKTLATLRLAEVNEEAILDILENLDPPTVKLVDNGIGPYEFWGAPGNDSRMEPEYDSEEWMVVITIYEPRQLIDCLGKILGLMKFIDDVTDDQRRYPEGDGDAADMGDYLELGVDKHLTFYPNSTRPHSLNCIFSWRCE